MKKKYTKKTHKKYLVQRRVNGKLQTASNKHEEVSRSATCLTVRNVSQRKVTNCVK